MYQLCPTIPTVSTSKLKRDHITYQCKGSVGGGREAGHGVGMWHFSKICCQIFLPTCKSFQSNAPKFPRADKFYQGCYSQGKVREKQKFFKVREKSGNFLKSQGTLFSGAMHQGWQWAFKGKINPLWTFSTWWSFLIWK